MLYRSRGTPFGSSPLLLPSVGIRCQDYTFDSYNYGIQNISDCRIVNQSSFCPVRDRLGISCGGTDINNYEIPVDRKIMVLYTMPHNTMWV
jgi:hypothetical protein